MNQFETQRVRDAARTLKDGRNQMNQGQRAVQMALANVTHNGILDILLRESEARLARVLLVPAGGSFKSDIWDDTDPASPKRVITMSVQTGVTEQQQTDANGNPVFQDGEPVDDAEGRTPNDAGWVPTYEQVPVMETIPVYSDEVRTLRYCAGKKFIYEDSTIADSVLYLHQSTDSPTVEEFVEILIGMFSFAVVTGQADNLVVQALFGRPSVSADQIPAKWDPWP